MNLFILRITLLFSFSLFSPLSFCAENLDHDVIREVLKEPNTKMAVWLYYPKKNIGNKVPVILIPPAGTRLFHGMNVSDGDSPEHVPYVKAGFAVVSFDISGSLSDNKDNAAVLKSAKQFMASNAGVNDGKNALNLVLKKYAFLDANKVYVAGHSSAGTLALTLAQHLPQVKACISYAPAADVAARLNTDMEFFEHYIPGFKRFINDTSPNRNISKLKVPVFLFNAKDDTNVTPKMMSKFAASLRSQKIDVTHKTVQHGGHYQSMINEGIPLAISWLKSISIKQEKQTGSGQTGSERNAF